MPTRVGGADVLNTTTDASSYTASSDFNVTGGADHVLVAFAVAQKSAATTSMTMTAEGVSMTQAAFLENTTATSGYPVGGIFYLMNPSAGLTTIVANFNSVTERCCVIHVEEWSGVDAADPLGAIATDTSGAGDEVLHVITPEASGNVVITGMAQRSASGGSWTPDANVTEVCDIQTSGGVASNDELVFTGYYTTVGTSSVSAGALNQSAGASNAIALLVEFRAAAVAKTITATGGSYSLAGTDAGTIHGWLVGATSGSYAITGTAAGLSRNLPLTAAAGSYAITGTNAGTLHGWLIGATAGSYAVTGSTAGLLHGWLLGATAGSYALTGTDAGLLEGRLVAAAAGSYSLTGTDAGLIRNLPLTAAAGSYTITGSPAGLVVGYLLTAAPGSYALTGTAAGLVHSYLIGADPGSYAITGTDATLVYGQPGAYTIVANPGSYTLTGSDAGLLTARLLTADPGAYTLTGSAAGLVKGWLVGADTGSYQITGSDAALIYVPVNAYSLAADAGSYLITGSPANLLSSAIVPEPFVFSDGGGADYRKKPKKPRKKQDLFDEVKLIVDPDEGKTVVAIVPRAELKAAQPSINEILDEADRMRLPQGVQQVTIHPDDEADVLQIMRLLAEMDD